MDNKKFDALVASIMHDAAEDGEPVTREEAEEMARMEMGAKEIRRYEQSGDAPKERKKKAVKKDPEKIDIIKKVYNFLLTIGYNDATIVNEQKEIKFENYSITLTKHRTKKER